MSQRQQPKEADEGEPRAEEGRLALAVALAAMLIPLNSTMLVVALPRMIDDLGGTLADGGWLVTAYLITMASLQPVTGKIGDRLGPRRVMLLGLAGFAVASVGAAVAPTIGTLIVLRAGQGVAGAMVMPNGTALVRRLVPASRLGARMGLVGATITAGAAIGPIAGGGLVALAGWRSVFAVNLPLVLLILVVARRGIPHVAPAPTSSPFDVGGSVGLLAVLGGGALLLTRAKGAAPAMTALAAAVLVVVAAVFLRHERRHSDPVVHTRLFRRRGYVAGAAGIALGNLAMYVTLLAVPVLLVRREEWGAGAVGGALTSLSVFSLVMSPVGGRLADRVGPRLPAVVGMAFGVAALTMLAFGARGLTLIVALGLAGLGFGLAFSAFQLSALASVEPSIAGAASGVISTCRYAGSITGTSLLAGPLAPQGIRFGPVFVMTALAAAGAGALAFLLPGRIVEHAPPEAEAEAVA